jgi:hypothetical protein
MPRKLDNWLAEGLNAIGHKRHKAAPPGAPPCVSQANYLAAAFNLLPALTFTPKLALIWIASPVWGLRPARAVGALDGEPTRDGHLRALTDRRCQDSEQSVNDAVHSDLALAGFGGNCRDELGTVKRLVSHLMSSSDLVRLVLPKPSNPGNR